MWQLAPVCSIWTNTSFNFTFNLTADAFKNISVEICSERVAVTKENKALFWAFNRRDACLKFKITLFFNATLFGALLLMHLLFCWIVPLTCTKVFWKSLLKRISTCPIKYVCVSVIKPEFVLHCIKHPRDFPLVMIVLCIFLCSRWIVLPETLKLNVFLVMIKSHLKMLTSSALTERERSVYEVRESTIIIVRKIVLCFLSSAMQSDILYSNIMDHFMDTLWSVNTWVSAQGLEPDWFKVFGFLY